MNACNWTTESQRRSIAFQQQTLLYIDERAQSNKPFVCIRVIIYITNIYSKQSRTIKKVSTYRFLNCFLFFGKIYLWIDTERGDGEREPKEKRKKNGVKENDEMRETEQNEQALFNGKHEYIYCVCTTTNDNKNNRAENYSYYC